MAPGKPQKAHRKRRQKKTSSREGISLRSLETLFSRHFLKLIGILFLGASLWFAASSADTLIRVAKTLVSPGDLISAPAGTGGLTAPVPAGAPSLQPAGSGIPRVLLFLAAAFAGWLILQLLGRWRKRAEYQIISVFLVFVAVLAIVRTCGWKPELVFSFLLLITGGLWYFGRDLSHTGTRINFLFAWGFFALWWLVKILINLNTGLLPVFYLFASLFFMLFHAILLSGGFRGRKQLSGYFEIGAIVANLIFHVVLMSVTILKFHGPGPVFLFVLSLSVVYTVTLLGMVWAGKPFRKTPFLISAGVLLCCLLPLLFGRNQIILFSGSLALFLLFYSRQTKDQQAILASLALVAIMLLVFTKDILLTYVRYAFIGGLLGNTSLFCKGLIAGLFVPAVVYGVREFLKDLEIRFSRKWFVRKRYLKLLKGSFLACIYFLFFWVAQYLAYVLVRSEEIRYLSWFSFHCLWFLIAIPWLAHQKSSLLQTVFLTGLILTPVYPTLLTLGNIDLLNLYVQKAPVGLTIFPLHYITAILFLAFISMILRFGGRTFRGSPVAGRIYLVYAVVMILFVAITEMIYSGILLTARSQTEADELRQMLQRIPATLILFVSGGILLLWGFLRQKRFGRTLAMILLFLAAFKLIYYDLPALNLAARVVLLFLTGSLFIGLSLGYGTARKIFRKKTPQSRQHGSRSNSPPSGSPDGSAE